MKYRDELIALVKEKKELSTLDDSFVAEIFDEMTVTVDQDVFDKYTSFKQCKRGELCKGLISSVRKRLREVYGLFVRKPLNKKQIEKIKTIDDPLIAKVLDAHQSSHERYTFYKQFYEKIFEKLDAIGLSKEYTLLDIACGSNPFALQFFTTKPKKYFATDLASHDMDCIQQFFSVAEQNGEAKAFDVLSEDFFSWFEEKEFDVCFLLKAIDSLEFVERHSSKKLLAALPTKFFVVTFPLLSVGGNEIISPERRSWFEAFCQAQNWTLEKILFPNELCYIIKKS